MRFFHLLLYLAILTASILALTITTRSPKHFQLSDLGKDLGPDYVGYKCGNRKFDSLFVFKALSKTCPKPRKSPYFWFSHYDRNFPKLFSEAEKLGFSKSSKIMPIREGFFKPFKFDYIVYEPSDCRLYGLVHQNQTKEGGAFEQCGLATWPTGFLDFFKAPP